MSELNNLVKKRGQLKGQLTRFKNFLTNFDVNNTDRFIELESRLQKFESLWDSFHVIQSDIEILETSDTQSEECVNFEQSYFELSTQARKFISQNPSNSNATFAITPSTGNDSNVTPQIKLPTLTLPEFYGGYEHWLQFHDTFDGLINKNSTLTDVQKFYYLQSCLKGEAMQVLNTIKITNDNYQIAWNLLIERYQNKRVMVNTHVKAIFELPIIKNESHTHLRNLLDSFLKHLKCLKSLGQPTDTWDTLLIHIISNKFDSTTKREWEQSSNSKEIPILSDLVSFLTDRCQLLETLHTNTTKTTPKFAFKSNNQNLVHVSTQRPTCAFCNDSHFNYNCEQFKNSPLHARQAEVRKNKLCTNCLRPGHFNRDCKSSSCRRCNKKHHTLLHEDTHLNSSVQSQSNTESLTATNSSVQNETKSENSNSPENSNKQIATHSTESKHEQTILSTAVVHILDKDGNRVKCRALLDCGSQSNFMTSSLIRRLRLPTSRINLTIAGISQAQNPVSEKTMATIQSIYNNYKVKLTFLILDKITDNIPVVSFPSSKINIPPSLNLADTNFNKSEPIDILLGAGIFWELLSIGQIKTGTNSLIFQKTKLGWLITGNASQSSHLNRIHCNLSTENRELQTQLEKFWQVEELPGNVKYTQEQRECEEHFLNTFTRDETGRFTVSLPLREGYTELGDSGTNAIKRFYSLENKLTKDSELRKLYNDFMYEYKFLGHMSQIVNPDDLNNTENKTVYYLPHHGVFKPSSTTTKLRVVFDASAKSTTGYSLNDFLKAGPVLQDDLFSIVLRFRTHNIVLIGDICKMYRQVKILDSERDLQRIVYRFNPEEELMHFKLNVVTYGTASASFLAIRSLHEVALQNQSEYPDACQTILRDFYVDDLITGADTVINATQLKHEITRILDSGGFNLRKFMSNNQDVLGHAVLEANSDYLISDDKNTKALGLSWNANSDTLKYFVTLDNISVEAITKRNILSTISKIFDPLGLIGPITMRGKILIQKLWQLHLDWDDLVPPEISKIWLEFYEQLLTINDINIPRHVILPNYSFIQLHGYCDASIAGFGACFYLRSVDNYGKIYSSLLCAKSRVAPLKSLSVPRLELCGAHLLAQLSTTVIKALRIPISQVFYWCDSSIVLAWLAAEPATWKTFVANRVSAIQEVTHTNQWNHVASADNPADIISKGVNPHQLIHLRQWWSGPTWLSKDETYWPQIQNSYLNEIPEKRKTVKISLSNVTFDQTIFDRFSSFSKLQRVTAYCKRFINNSNPKSVSKLTGNLTTIELNQSLLSLLKIAQSHSFLSDIHSLKNNARISNNSKIISLNPFIDKDGIIRVGGRISKAQINFDKKYPILLPHKHPLTDLIIKHEHLRHLHAGPQGVLAAVRQKFWPISGRNAVKRVLRTCVTCFKVNPQKTIHQMGDLPYFRITPARPFSTVGIDFAGPFQIKDSTLRNRKLVKCYICIFVCFATKAVHIELVGDLSTQCFLNSFKRFIARRGVCTHVFSDNAKNFIGANNELRKIYKFILNSDNKSELDQFLSQNSIQWHFIPPRSPHFGGLWEAAVKSAKFHMKRIIGNANLTYEEMHTVLTQIEAVLNSRPLTPLSSDPGDLLALTPGHFIIGERLTALPEDDVTNIPMTRLSRYKRLQQISQHFWKRWSSEYLSSLHQRTKWKFSTPSSVKIGSMVILRDENLPPLSWKLGRIIDTHPGEDGVLRVVSVKTTSGVVKRAITKVCILPIDSDVSEQ